MDLLLKFRRESNKCRKSKQKKSDKVSEIIKMNSTLRNHKGANIWEGFWKGLGIWKYRGRKKPILTSRALIINLWRIEIGDICEILNVHIFLFLFEHKTFVLSVLIGNETCHRCIENSELKQNLTFNVQK